MFGLWRRDFSGLAGFHVGNPLTMPLRLPALIAAAASAALALSAPAPADAAVHLSQIGSFAQPVYVTAPPGDPHRVFVVEQQGRIIEVRDGQKLDTPFLDIHADVKYGGEQGLLSMAFAPDYGTSGRYYVYYTAPLAGDSAGNVITIEEFSPAGRRIVFTVPHPSAGNHNGGQLQFGPDGLLYAGTGDGGGGDDTFNNAQTPTSKLGKLLRIDPLSGNAEPAIYANGLRNPFRFSFDRQTGDLIIGDVGQNEWEEVDFSPSGTPAGRNYGWPCREGAHNHNACTASGAVDPVLEKNHSSDGYCAIIGGYVVRDTTVPDLAGRYVYGDNCNTHVRKVTLPAASGDSDTLLDVPGLSSFGEDSCGHVYATSLNGPVYRIDGDAFTPCPEGSPPGPGPGPGPSPDPGNPPGTNPPPTPAPDTRAPVVRVGAHHKQHVLNLRGVRLSVSCDELCGATATGVVRIAGRTRTYALLRVARQLKANRRVKLTLKASSRARRAMRSALAHHRRVSIGITVVGRDAAGNAGRAHRAVLATL
jgi:glucose/arabinose dehydrogenase